MIESPTNLILIKYLSNSHTGGLLVLLADERRIDLVGVSGQQTYVFERFPRDLMNHIKHPPLLQLIETRVIKE